MILKKRKTTRTELQSTKLKKTEETTIWLINRGALEIQNTNDLA